MLISILSITACTKQSKTNEACLSSIKCKDAIRLRLLNMYEQDQETREALANGNNTQTSILKNDLINQQELKSIIQKIGWP